MKVKVCGITDAGDAAAAADCGAWALGFVFWEKSPRFVSIRTAAGIISALPPSVLPVGVFVDATAKQLAETAAATGIRACQLHGRAGPSFCSVPGLPVIRAVRPRRAADLAGLSAYPPLFGFLVDAAVRGEHGGTGRLADWDLARGAKKFGRIILAGGLTPDNAAAAVRAVRPFALDVSSGLESGPGRKSRKKIERFFKAIREAR